MAGIVERRHTLPILANVLLRKDADNVSFLATDVEIQIRTTASLGAGADAAATTVSARKLIDILKMSIKSRWHYAHFTANLTK